MIYTKLTKKAMIIAYNAHLNQFDKAKVPYIYHPIHLAEQMETESECLVALLHDVVEDSDISFKDLAKDFPEEVISALKLLTKDKDMDYLDYVKKIKTNKIATKVKKADLIHNSDYSRLNEATEKDIKRIEKYNKALEILNN